MTTFTLPLGETREMFAAEAAQVLGITDPRKAEETLTALGYRVTRRVTHGSKRLLVINHPEKETTMTTTTTTFDARTLVGYLTTLASRYSGNELYSLTAYAYEHEGALPPEYEARAERNRATAAAWDYIEEQHEACKGADAKAVALAHAGDGEGAWRLAVEAATARAAYDMIHRRRMGTLTTPEPLVPPKISQAAHTALRRASFLVAALDRDVSNDVTALAKQWDTWEDAAEGDEKTRALLDAAIEAVTIR